MDYSELKIANYDLYKKLHSARRAGISEKTLVGLLGLVAYRHCPVSPCSSQSTDSSYVDDDLEDDLSDVEEGFTMDAEGKFFFVRSMLNEFVLEISGGAAAPGTPIVMFPHHGGDSQLWFEDFDNQVIRSKLDDSFVLEMTGAGLVLNVFHPNEYNQKLKTAGDRVCVADNPHRVVDIANQNKAPGAGVIMWDYAGTPNQKFDIVYLPPVFCFIVSQMHGKVIDVRDNDTSPGTRIVMYKQWETPADNQLWYEDKYGYIKSKMTGMVFDTTEGSARTQPYHPSVPGRQWVKSGDFIMNKIDPNQVLDIKGEDDDNGAKLVAYKNKDKPNQKWTFVYLG